MNTQIKHKEAMEKRAQLESEYIAIVEKGEFTAEIKADLEARKAAITEAIENEKLLAEALEMEARKAANTAPVVFSTSNAGQQKEVRQFNLVKFINEAGKGNLTGFEAEMHQEAVNELRGALKGTDANQDNPSGFGIPTIVMDNMNGRFEKRAQSAGTDSAGGYAIQTDVGSMIEPLYPNPVVAQMGATVFDNLVGNVSLPKDTNLFSFAFKAENAAADETSKTFGQVTLSPKRLAGEAYISRRLLLQEKSQTMQSYLQGEFLKGVNVAVDSAALNGSGATDNPTGILNTSGISNIIMGANGAVPSWEQILRFAKTLDQNDALAGNLGYLTTPEMKSILMSTLKNATYGTTGYIWETDNMMAGYKASASSTVPQGLTIGSSSYGHAMIFGNWADLLVGKWGGTFILVDTITKASTSQVKIYCELQMDVAVRRTQSFCISKSAINGLSS